MNNKLRILSVTLAGVLYSATMMAQPSIALVNATDLFNKSNFVQTANKELQDSVKKMEATLKTKQDSLQKIINDYQQMKDSKKKASLAKTITDEQTNLSKMTKEYQLKIQEEQNKGMQEFSKLVKDAVTKIAKAKDIHTVLNSNSIIYSDNTWVDITEDVAAAMKKK